MKTVSVFFIPLLLAASMTTQAAEPEKLAADTPRTTPAGATFTAPAGWSISTATRSVVLHAPEGDSHMAIVDVRAADAAAAVAWAEYKPI